MSEIKKVFDTLFSTLIFKIEERMAFHDCQYHHIEAACKVTEKHHQKYLEYKEKYEKLLKEL
ncbi:hypothetical protein LCGC14_0223650 [marine sediment metagenome]|uniref:Uncharacterized protein n=1 Tax=marine sediment metagenome TaxID=412755 RepID=A0A0F9UTI9_9ZZZZ